MTNKEFLDDLSGKLAVIYDSKESRAIAVRTLLHFYQKSDYEYLINPDGDISPDVVTSLMIASDKLLTAMPLQYVLGYQPFAGMDIIVEDGVLIPRRETEELVRIILADNLEKQGLRILDIGCGSGCIAVSLNRLFADRNISTEIYACDISDKALYVTNKNIEKFAPDGGIRLFQYDLLSESPIPIKDSSLDIIVSNPPYVLEREREIIARWILEYEPHTALFVPDHTPLIFYAAIIRLAIIKLREGGKIYLEINEAFGKETQSLLDHSGFKHTQIVRDLDNKDRFVTGILKTR